MKIGQMVMKAGKGELMRRKSWPAEYGSIGLQSVAAKSKINVPFFYKKLECGSVEPWTCSHTDLLADDWLTVKK